MYARYCIFSHPSCFLFVLQKEKFDDSNVQVSPPGFHVLFLPFAEELRKIKFDESLAGMTGVCVCEGGRGGISDHM